MNYKNLLLLFLAIAGIACKQAKPPATTTDTATKKEIFYPYPQYIQSQIAYLDSANLALEMVITENGVLVDSEFISRDKFKEMAKAFTLPDPNSSELSTQYQEESFQDLSINSITFSISAKNSKLPLQHADVLLNPQDKQVKYIVLKKEEQSNEGLVTSSLLWRHNMNFQVVSDITQADGSKKTRVVKVVWDKPVNELIQ